MLENEIEDHPDFPPPPPGTDQLGPPIVSTLVHCIHCNNEYDSYQIKWVVRRDEKGELWPHWACPIPGCDGAGFCFDIWPIDPEWRNEHGEKVWCDDDEEDGEDELDKEGDPALDAEIDADVAAVGSGDAADFAYHPEDEVVDEFIDELTRELEAYDDDDDWLPNHPGTY